MVCEANETDVSIEIPAVMLPQDAGASLEKLIANSTGISSFVILQISVALQFT